jgi:hypothetical protein
MNPPNSIRALYRSTHIVPAPPRVSDYQVHANLVWYVRWPRLKFSNSIHGPRRDRATETFHSSIVIASLEFQIFKSMQNRVGMCARNDLEALNTSNSGHSPRQNWARVNSANPPVFVFCLISLMLFSTCIPYACGPLGSISLLFNLPSNASFFPRVISDQLPPVAEHAANLKAKNFEVCDKLLDRGNYLTKNVAP